MRPQSAVHLLIIVLVSGGERLLFACVALRKSEPGGDNMEKRARISKDAAILALTLAAMIIADAVLFATGRHAADKEGIGVMVAAGVTIGMYSFLYKDNPIFKAVEHIYVGVSADTYLRWHGINTFLPDVINPLVFPRWEKSETLLSWRPLTLGVLMLMRLSSKYGWYSRISFAFVIGFSSGIAIPNYIDTIIFRQLKYSSLLSRPLQAFFDYFNAAVILVGTLSVSYVFLVFGGAQRRFEARQQDGRLFFNGLLRRFLRLHYNG
jgi:hypothetical protein